MSLTVLAWLAVGAYALHILEEHILGWHGWARKTMNLSMEWDAYTTVEVVLLILGAIAAMLAPALPVLALAYAAFLVINVTFFHLLPMIISGGNFSPGIITGVLLFYPVGYYAYAGSTQPQSVIMWSVVIGAAIIAWPVLLLKLRQQPYFKAGAGGDGGSARKAVRRR
jgi:hypothetical protein